MNTSNCPSMPADLYGSNSPIVLSWSSKSWNCFKICSLHGKCVSIITLMALEARAYCVQNQFRHKMFPSAQVLQFFFFCYTFLAALYMKSSSVPYKAYKNLFISNSFGLKWDGKLHLLSRLVLQEDFKDNLNAFYLPTVCRLPMSVLLWKLFSYSSATIYGL